MLSPTDLRKDTLIDFEGSPYKVLEYAQKQMGRGGSIVNTKLKNMITGQVIDKTFRNDEKVAPAEIDRKTMQYLYSAGNSYSVMDQDTYETIEVDNSIDDNVPKYIVEGGTIDALVYDDKIIGFEWPKNVTLKVTSAPGADKGNSASATTKEVEVETGIKVQAPQFIKEGDIIKVDTRSGDYLERAK
jgi:elongation factor P